MSILICLCVYIYILIYIYILLSKHRHITVRRYVFHNMGPFRSENPTVDFFFLDENVLNFDPTWQGLSSHFAYGNSS